MKKYINIFKKKIADYSVISPLEIDKNPRIISFTFDDVPESAFDNAGKILDKYKVNGTFYICLSFLKGNNPNGFYSESNLSDCIKAGNELGCHTFSHFHFFNTTDKQFILNDLEKNRREFGKLNLGVTLKNFSYPFGEQTRLAKQCASSVYASCRGIDHGINSGKSDLNNLKAIKLYEGKHSLQQIDKILNDFSKNGGWLIFYTHDVQEDFSQYGCSPEYFEAVVKNCIEYGFSIRTVEQALTFLEKEKENY